MPAKKQGRGHLSKSAKAPNWRALPPSIVAQIVVACLLGEGSNAEIANRLKVDVTTVSKYRKEIPAQLTNELAKTKADTGELLSQYMREGVETCLAIFRSIREPEKLSQLSASDAVSIIGAISDRVFILAQAAERADQARRAAAEERWLLDSGVENTSSESNRGEGVQVVDSLNDAPDLQRRNG